MVYWRFFGPGGSIRQLHQIREIARQRCGPFFVDGDWGVPGGWHRARLEARGGAFGLKDESEGDSGPERACRAWKCLSLVMVG